MRKVFRPLFIASTLCASAYVYAQEQSDALFFVESNKANDTLQELLITTQQPHFQDPKAPRFLLTDRKGKVAFGIGGYVKMTTSYDMDGMANGVDFIPYNISVPNNNLHNQQLQMDVSTSRLFFKLVGNTAATGNFEAYIETDFRGPSHTLRLRKAYVSMKGFLLGQTWSTFNDLSSVPPTVDFQNPNGVSEVRHVQLRYTHQFSPKWSGAIAVEMSDLSNTYSLTTSKLSQRIPDIPLYVQYQWNDDSHIRLSGLLRNMYYRDVTNSDNKSTIGWGAMLSGTASLGKMFQLYYSGIYGQGIGEYINDLNGNGFDLVYNNKVGGMQALPMYGLTGGLQWNICKKSFASVSYSQARTFAQNGFDPSTGYHFGQYIVGNIFYNLTNNLQLGAEYLHGVRSNNDDQMGHANRLQVMIQYNF